MLMMVSVLNSLHKAAILVTAICVLASVNLAAAKTSRGAQIDGHLVRFTYRVLFAAISGEGPPNVSGDIIPQCSIDDFRKYEAYSATKDVVKARQLFRTCEFANTVSLIDQDDTVIIQHLLKVPDEHCLAYSTILEAAFARFRTISPEITKDPIEFNNDTGLLRPHFAVASDSMRPTVRSGVFATACKPREGLHVIFVWKTQKGL
jgi:hypothetical protein